ncbi:alpha-ketoacid dehydrogenase subunit beta [Rhizomonospora bruguierae]|uniref:alpha-ketoacid dehydrogenase subunit beta n=1 Tax=Rhizomonospora bruguierae TaxID=1581705 RepID=UPI001BCA9B1D|nr:transketolase C-terminal domain-containing protein [Micromonospora sp. NBRC 107566]
MAARQRVAESLNAALATALADDPRLYLLGEDILDPYGGAFKVTRGLSTRFPRQVLGTPISEAGIVGLAGGLALAGDRAIVEIMFGDFATLAFDQVVNFAAKSVTMYGRRVPMPVVLRCPTGGNRGYGPTHSQSLQKHFVGVPSLAVYELTPYHDTTDLLRGILAAGEPAVLFEDKVLYTDWMRRDGAADDLFRYDVVGDWPGVARVRLDDAPPECIVVAPGGVADRALAAMRRLLLESEIVTELHVPARLYPVDLSPVLDGAGRAGRVLVVEDSTAGGTWGAEVAHTLHTELWGRLRRPVRLLHAADSVVPAAPHLERAVLPQDGSIAGAVEEMCHG